MMNKESTGERIRNRRKALALTQLALAKEIGVSHVAVSQWEKEETVPRGENLLRLAALLQCTPAWIIDGEGELFTTAVNSSRIATVPLLSLQQAAGWLEESRIALQQQATHFLYCDTPLSETALAVTLEDNAMEPHYRAGDQLIFDPSRPARPGEVVLAIAGGEAVVRIYRLLSTRDDDTLFALRALNTDFPALRSDEQRLQLVGSLTEQRRHFG